MILAFKWLQEAGEVEDSPAWESPILFEQMSPPDVPASLLPDPLGAFAKALSDVAETPEALAVFVALGVVAVAASRRYVVMPIEGWMEHVNVYTAIALPPANNKSLVIRRATKPLIEWERKQREELQPKIAQARSKRKSEERLIEHNRKAAVREQDSVARTKLMDAVAELEASLTEIPMLPKLFTNDATPESLATSVAEQGGHFAIISDEGGITETLAGLYSNGAANIDILLKGIDGGEVRVQRKERTYDLNPVLNIPLAIQPQILTNMADKRAFTGNGLLDRFLFLVPQSKLGHRTLDGPPVPCEVADEFEKLIFRLLDVETSSRGGHGMHVLTLSPDAFSMWQTFRLFIERELRPEGRLAEASGWGGKLAGFALRIAGLFHVVSNSSHQQVIEKAVIERALAMAKLLIEHRLAAQELMGRDITSHDAKYLYDWIIRGGNTKFTRTECLRANHGHFKSKKSMDSALDSLSERRIISRCRHEQTSKAGRPPEIYEVNPLVFGHK